MTPAEQLRTAVADQAAGPRPWELITPHVARRRNGTLTAYVSTVLNHGGRVAHYNWWVEANAQHVVSDAADTAYAAVAAANAAVGSLRAGSPR